MTPEELTAARVHDAKCGPDCYLLPLAMDRRLLIRHVDALHARLQAIICETMDFAQTTDGAVVVRVHKLAADGMAGHKPVTGDHPDLFQSSGAE